jgi:hypothetical protein
MRGTPCKGVPATRLILVAAKKEILKVRIVLQMDRQGELGKQGTPVLGKLLSICITACGTVPWLHSEF